MSSYRCRKPDTITPMHVVMICLVTTTVAAGSLLLSAAESTALVDGAVDWRVESPLRAVVQLLCLNYEWPTVHAGEVKNFVLGIGAGLAILAIAIAVIAKRRDDETAGIGDEPLAAPPPPVESHDATAGRKGHITPLVAAQVLVGLFLLWSFASSRWSAAPDLAIGGSIWITICFLWAMGIGNGLNRSAALIASRMLVGVAAITALVALWYYYGRNPTLRAKFPFGNPTFLAACLIPGIILTVTLIIETGVAMLIRRRAACFIIAVVALAIVVVLSWAFQLADSRGALVGLVVGVSAAVFFALRGRARSIPVLLALGALACAWLYHPLSSTQASTHGRDTSVRLRLYAWQYAWDMFNEKPLTGYGQGGFVLAGDARAVNDVLDDPLPFEARIAHVHNEWLEVLADLGSVGFALIVAALVLTLRAGMTALKASPPLGERWALIGLMGALVGLTAEEAFGVGLRVSGVPTMFYTVLGLVWALAAKRPNGIVVYLAAQPRRRVLAGIGGIAAATVVMAVIQNDFLAARNAHGVVAALQSEDFVDAAEMADDATKSRLNPQRTLENLARLSEAQMLVASVLQRRAIDRETRGSQSDLSNPQLLALAKQDREYSDHHSRRSSQALKELVARSPSYFNHGRIEYELNLIQAANAAARNDREEHDQCLKNAAAAIERELLRRPFDPSITLKYLSVADNTVDLAQRINILARPLRHHRIATPYVDFLAHMTTLPGFEDEFTRIVRQAHDAVTTPPALYAGDEAAAAWAPEKLRLAATIHFRRGNYGAAREALEIAARSYDALAAAAPIGAASCYAELADCQFFAEPDKPHAALDSALRAISLAPKSLTGRRLKRNAGHRMVDYYLAAGQEDEAQRLLGELAPPRATDDAIRGALGFRYRAMCEALRDRRLAQVLRKPINELLPQLQRWAARAIELNPDDHLAHYLATDLAFHAGDCDATGKHLQLAIENGLEAQLARQFVRAARDKRPGCAALDRIWTTLAATGHSHAPADEPRSAPTESPSNPPPTATPEGKTRP